MRGWAGWVAVALLLLLAVGFQGQAERMSVFGATADYPLVVVCTVALFETRVGASWVGLLAGVCHGAMVGTSLGFFAVSRALAGFGCAWSRGLGLAPNIGVTAATVFVGTVFAQILALFLPPAKPFFASLGDTISTATYNGVLAIPLYALLTRMFRPVKN